MAFFAIAYAVHLANGSDPAKIKFEQKKMRAHFTECIKKKTLEVFPIEKNYHECSQARHNQTIRHCTLVLV